MLTQTAPGRGVCSAAVTDQFATTSYRPRNPRSANKAIGMTNRSPAGVLSHTRRKPCTTAGDGGTGLPSEHELRSIKLDTYSYYGQAQDPGGSYKRYGALVKLYW